MTTVGLVVVGLIVAWRTAGSERLGRLRAVPALLGAALLFVAVAASSLVFGAWKIELFGARLLSVGTPHKPLSVGLLFLILAGAMHPSVRAAWRRRSPLAFYALAAVVMWVFSLGPAPTLMNRPFIYKAPYAWLLLFPGVDGVRAPARFWMLAALCLAAAAGLALLEVAARWPRVATVLPLVASVGLLLDAWPEAMQMPRPPELRPIHTRAVARLELPMTPLHDLTALYRATDHQRPLLNGYSGYFAPHYWALQYLIEQHDPTVLARLSAFGPVEVVVDHEFDEGGEWRKFVGGQAQAEPVYQDDHYTTYRIPRGPYIGALPRPSGEPLPIASIASSENGARTTAMTDHDLVSRWDAGRPQRPVDSITVDLGQAREVSGAEMMLGGFVADFPRQLSIDVSVDGETWSQVWNGGTALLAFSAALEDPLNVTLPFPFETRRARYVRFTQHAIEPTYYWSVAELRISGR
ncbi:MAG: discoidin domain-containing protein [Acidobacteriota bacterium]